MYYRENSVFDPHPPYTCVICEQKTNVSKAKCGLLHFKKSLNSPPTPPTHYRLPENFGGSSPRFCLPRSVKSGDIRGKRRKEFGGLSNTKLWSEKRRAKERRRRKKTLIGSFGFFVPMRHGPEKFEIFSRKKARQQLGTFRVCFVSHFSEFLFSFSYAFFPSGSKFTCLFFLPPPSPPCHIIPRQFSVGGSFLDKAVLPPFLGRRM